MTHIQEKHSGAKCLIYVGEEIKLVYNSDKEVDLYHCFGQNPSDENRNLFSDFHLDKSLLKEFKRQFMNYLV